ncbi:MAG TPA: pyruvate formate-lyase-activating protein [Planctomycetota bacterium]|nr:pyruvate formate-lyase-activating protein [Planctomycetota bacterium]
MKAPVGRVHSVETLGTRDGPALRCVFFLAGCNFRCRFCHNPDTWSARGSKRMAVSEAAERLERLIPYLRGRGGGVTASGGEPALQPAFVEGVFRAAHGMGLATALDTNGSCPPRRRRRLLAVTDVVLLDVKASEPKLHRRLTGAPLGPVLAFGRMAARIPGRLVIRRVLLPGVNDSPEELDALANYALSLANRPEIELIPYHRLGVHKWAELGRRYPLEGLKPPTAGKWRAAARRLETRGLVVRRG